MSHYEKNLAALEQADTRLAQAIRAADPVHAYDSPDTHNWNATGIYYCIVCGFGSGAHVRWLWDTLPAGGILIVAEHDVSAIAGAFYDADFSDMLASGRFHLITANTRAAVISKLDGLSALLTIPSANGPRTMLCNHPSSIRRDPEFYIQFQRSFVDFLHYVRIAYATAIINGPRTCQNILNNLGRYVTTSPIDTLRNFFFKTPAILVSAGPSLQKNIHLLHEVRDGKRHAVIIAVQTMLKPLLAMGIEPDFVTSLDYSELSGAFFTDLPSLETAHLVCEPKAHWSVADRFTGSMSMTGNTFADAITDTRRPGLRAGSTVAHLSFYLAEYMGCSPIIMIGQDLAFSGGKHYGGGARGRFKEEGEAEAWIDNQRERGRLRHVPGWDGSELETDEPFFIYLQQFERDFAATKATVIDATEGGAAKRGATPMTLRHALDDFCTAPIDFGGRPWQIGWHINELSLERVVEQLGECRAEAQTLLGFCDDLLPLLEELRFSEEQADVFKRINAVRGREANVGRALFLTGEMNTYAELRLSQTDLLIAAMQPGEARQLAQIERDMTYQRGLRQVCLDLMRILDEAAERSLLDFCECGLIINATDSR